MFSLLTTAARLVLFEQVLQSHLGRLHLAVTRRIPLDSLVFLAFDYVANITAAPPAFSGWVDGEGVLSTCTSSSSSGNAEAAAKLLLDSYLHHNRSRLLWADMEYTSSHNCYVCDYRNMNIWVMSDYVGSFPWWYGVADPDDFILSNDWLLVRALGGGGRATPAGAGTLHSIDISTRQYVHFSHFQSNYMTRPKEDPATQIISKYSFTLLARTMQSLTTAIVPPPKSPSHKRAIVLVEADSTNSMTLITECALLNMGVSFHILHTAPLFATEGPARGPKGRANFSDIWRGNSYNEDLYDSKDETMPAEKVAINRWNFCAHAHAALVRHCTEGDDCAATIIAVADGLSQQSDLSVYFQKLFCGHFNITVEQPFNSLDFQLSIWSNRHADSYLREAVGFLSTQGVCSIEHTSASFSSDSSDSPSITSIAAGEPTDVARIWRAAYTHASASHRVALVLATSGYEQILGNFLCFVRALPGHKTRNIIVLTMSEIIARLAADAGAGYYIPSMSNSSYGFAKATPVAQFGTPLYQFLMLQRTKAVHELLLLGFQPVIADIDTVWKKDPLSIVDIYADSNDFDIATCYDEEEICGCFVALNSKDDSILFWDSVHRKHRDIVGSNLDADVASTRRLQKDFAESEQKVLTHLLLKGGYAKEGGRVKVLTLPRDMFPSGMQYFNFRSVAEEDVAVIHNNFVVGMEYKVHRFRYRSLWLYSGPSTAPNPDPTFDDRCTFDPRSYFITILGTGADFSVSMPSLVQTYPSHNGVYVTDRGQGGALLMGSTEGLPEEAACLRQWLDVNPPSYFNTYGFSIQQFFLRATNVSKSFTLSLCDRPHISVSSTAAFDTTLYSLDFAGDGDAIRAAGERVIASWLDMSSSSSNGESSSSYTAAKDTTVAVDGESAAPEPPSASDRRRVEFAIKVLAFKRPSSLKRLLTSLALAHYPKGTELSIDLEIFVDGGRTAEESALVDQTSDIADAFSWSLGGKRVVRSTVNRGLVAQWISAWRPDVDSAPEVATFIFEDDIELSPLYFEWASRAVEAYYTDAAADAHRELLRAVLSARGRGADAMSDAMRALVARTAGLPLMYGVCLQRQHQHPFAYPSKLEVRNGHLPYLHSLVGSWGPLFLPVPWLAFLEWQQEISASIASPAEMADALGTRTIVDHYMNENNNLWTPYMVKFSTVTGYKCLYANLPHSLALATSHREGGGESYEATEGADSSLVRWEDVYACNSSNRESAGSTFSEYTSAHRKCLAARKSYLSTPPLERVWQLDLSLRRHGALGQDKTFAATAPEMLLARDSGSSERRSFAALDKAYTQIDTAVDAYSSALREVFGLDLEGTRACSMHRGLIILLADIVIASAATRIVHIEPSGLLTYLVSLHPHLSHELLSTTRGTCAIVRGTVAHECSDDIIAAPGLGLGLGLRFHSSRDCGQLLVANLDLVIRSSFPLDSLWSRIPSECVFDQVLLLHSHVSSAPQIFRVGKLEYTIEEDMGGLGQGQEQEQGATLYSLTEFIDDDSSAQGTGEASKRSSILLTKYIYDSIDSVTFLNRRRQIMK